jgi:hypothetical protein
VHFIALATTTALFNGSGAVSEMLRSLRAPTLELAWLCLVLFVHSSPAAPLLMTNRLFYAYARHALVTALRMARVTTGSTVLVPHFICRDVLASISAVGANPVFYDIDDDLQVSQNTMLPSAAAVLAVNYFGFPSDLGRLRQQLSDPTTIIIEDNAHGWLSADENGVPLGTRTALGITSFRKTIRVVDGAFLDWNIDQLSASVVTPNQPTSRTEVLPLSFRIRAVVASIDQRSSLPLMTAGRRSIRRLRSLTGARPINERAQEEWQLPAHEAIHQSSLERFERTNLIAEVSRRRNAFATCQTLAERFDIGMPTIDFGPHVSPQGFPFFADSGNIDSFRTAVTRAKIGEVVSWPSLPSATTLSPTSKLRSVYLVNFLQ